MSTTDSHSRERGGDRSPLRTVPAARVVLSEADRAEVLARIDHSLQSGSLTLGPNTDEFERRFAETLGLPPAVATSSGTSALEIIFRALGVEGSEVVVPANTFFATAAAVMHAGGSPRFADVDPNTMALSAESVEAALTVGTKAVVVVHIGGLVTPELPAIVELCERRGVALVEDAAHAHGSSLAGKPAGGFGRAAAFSFYPTKVLTSAEGGMIVSADEGLRREALVYRDQGKASFLGQQHVRLGYAWRMSELQAALGVVHLGRLEEFVTRRRAVAALYDRALVETPGAAPLAGNAHSSSNYYKYPVLLDADIDRERLRGALRDQGISLSGEVYAEPLHKQPVFAELAHGALPVAEDVCARHVCLPVHSDMTDDEAAYVAERFCDTLSSLRKG